MSNVSALDVLKQALKTYRCEIAIWFKIMKNRIFIDDEMIVEEF